MNRHLCAGHPADTCLTMIPAGRVYCRFCRYNRQRDLAASLPPLPRVGDVLADLPAVAIACGCGGESTAPDHADGLAHRRWVWLASDANR